MNEIKTGHSKSIQVEFVKYNGTNLDRIKEFTSNWQIKDGNPQLWDDVYDGWVDLSVGQIIVRHEARDGEKSIQVFDEPLFWELYKTNASLSSAAAFKLRKDCAAMASQAFQGSAYAPTPKQLVYLAGELESYIKGDLYD